MRSNVSFWQILNRAEKTQGQILFNPHVPAAHKSAEIIAPSPPIFDWRLEKSGIPYFFLQSGVPLSSTQE